MKALGMVSSTVAEKGEARKYTRYFIKSLTDLHEFADYVRKHWSTENQLHWCLYVIFRERILQEQERIYSPLNMNVLRKAALNLVSQAPYGRISKKRLIFKVALDSNVLLDILFFPKK